MIEPDIEALRAVFLVQRLDAPAGEDRHLGVLLHGDVLVVRHVTVRGHQKVAGVVRELVQDDEGKRAARKDQRLGIVGWVERGKLTQEAALHAVIPLDVRHAPGGPEPFHHE